MTLLSLSKEQQRTLALLSHEIHVCTGLTLLFLSKERRRTLALYMLARLMQCAYNSLKEQGRFHFWGSDWAYGDALLFALSSAQVQ